MSLIFKMRSLVPERMDLEPLTEAEAAEILKTLETINVWLGGVRATLWHLKRFARRWDPGQRIRIIDWGTGGADIPRAIVRWGRLNGFAMEVVGVDNNPVVAAYARDACRDYPEIRIVCAAVDDELSGPSFDYAISSLTLHHLTDDQIVELLKKSDRLTTRGMIMNDLKRSARAWAWIWTLSRLGRAHPIVQNDGPLSVQRAFTPPELRNLARLSGVPYTDVHTHFGYRLTLAGEKQ
jgi:hypothetical protein